VYDEKIPDAGALRKQRTRWINAYFKYWGLNAGVLGRGVATLDPKLVYFGLNLLQPPLFLLIGASLACAILSLALGWAWTVAWVGGLFLFLATIPVVMFMEGAGAAVWQSATKVPHFMWQQLLGMLKMKKANQSFLKTEHHQVFYIEDILG